MRLLWFADVLRAAGLTVVEEPDWKTRGSDTYGPIRGLIVHETRGSATSTVAGEINVLINGRVGLSGPISQLFLSRAGVWHVVASGTCHHAKIGWGGPHAGYGNDSLIGVEAQHGESEDWADKPAQYASYVTGVAAICGHLGWPVSVVAGHKEHQPGDKPDPEFSMGAFRTAVAQEMEDDMDLNLNQLVPIGVKADGSNDNVPLWLYLRTMAIRVDYLANKTGLVAKLDAILAAALDDGDTTVVLDPAALAELTAVKDAIAALPATVADAVNDDASARLAG